MLLTFPAQCKFVIQSCRRCCSVNVQNSFGSCACSTTTFLLPNLTKSFEPKTYSIRLLNLLIGRQQLVTGLTYIHMYILTAYTGLYACRVLLQDCVRYMIAALLCNTFCSCYFAIVFVIVSFSCALIADASSISSKQLSVALQLVGLSSAFGLTTDVPSVLQWVFWLPGLLLLHCIA